jgi:hypothetical protein
MPGWFNISLFVRSHMLVIVQDYMHILCIYAWILIYMYVGIVINKTQWSLLTFWIKKCIAQLTSLYSYYIFFLLSFNYLDFSEGVHIKMLGLANVCWVFFVFFWWFFNCLFCIFHSNVLQFCLFVCCISIPSSKIFENLPLKQPKYM